MPLLPTALQMKGTNEQRKRDGSLPNFFMLGNDNLRGRFYDKHANFRN